MKNIFGFILTALIVSAIYGCKKSDDAVQIGKSLPPSASTSNNDAKTKALIVGKWIIQADTLVQTVDGNQKQFVVFRVPADGSWYETFFADGTWNRKASIQEPTETYSIKNNVITFTEASRTTFNGTVIPGDVDKAYIRSISANKLVIFYADTTVTLGSTSIVYEVFHYSK